MSLIKKKVLLMCLIFALIFVSLNSASSWAIQSDFEKIHVHPDIHHNTIPLVVAKSTFNDRQSNYPEINGARFYISPEESHQFVKEYTNQNKLISEYSKQLWEDDNTYVVGGSGNLTLINNIYSKNPSMGELENFLRKDQTDSNIYKDNGYVCVDFAVDLHNAAEKNGIACVIVNIEFENDSNGHSLNGFIVDNQWVFIDDTASVNYAKNMDRRTYPEIGKQYTGEFLFRSDYQSDSMGKVSSIVIID